MRLPSFQLFAALVSQTSACMSVMLCRAMSLKAPSLLWHLTCRFREFQALREMEYNFIDKPTPARHVVNITSTMQTVGRSTSHTLLALHHVPLEYDEAAIQAVLSQLRPDTMRCMWTSKNFQVLGAGQVAWHVHIFKGWQCLAEALIFTAGSSEGVSP